MEQERTISYGQEFCPMDRALKALAGKWKPMILHMLLNETLHFGAIARNLPRASRKVLAAQLRDLVSAGLVERSQLADARQHVHYGLAERGKSLSPILQQLYAWGQFLPAARGGSSASAS